MRITLRPVLCVLALTSVLVAPALGGDTLTIALPAPGTPAWTPTDRPEGAPRAGDVCFSSRWRRPLNDEDPHNTFRDARSFHATRLDWVYSTDTTWIRTVTRRGYPIGTALNSKLPDTPGVEIRRNGRILDRTANPVTAPWMAGWDAWWGCVNSPGYREIFFEHARRCIDGGAHYLHVDDPDMNYRAVEWGGCFCPFCKEKTAGLGVNFSDSLAMRAFQRESVEEFYRDFRSRIDAYAGRRVPLSCNNYRAVWNVFPYALFDFGMAELPEHEAEPDTIYQRIADARARGKAQILTFVSENVDLTRRVIATAYACGSHVLVPWDVYLKSTPEGSIRYFGRPADFADLYGYVRACSEYFDGYVETMVAGLSAGPGSARSHGDTHSGTGRTLAVVRVKPDHRDAPVVVHVVDWSGEPDSTLLRITRDPAETLGSVTATMLVPVAYAEPDHRAVELTKDFRRLAGRIPLEIRSFEGFFEILLPPLTPWGVVVLRGTDSEAR